MAAQLWHGFLQLFAVCQAILLLLTIGMVASVDINFSGDILTPYANGQHGSPHTRRYVRDCQPVKYGNSTIQSFPSHGLVSTQLTLPISTTRMIMDTAVFYRTSFGHLSVVNNPLRTLSVLEPLQKGGCSMGLRQTVVASALQRNCLVAMNAGFFNTHTGACYGSIYSDGRLVKNGQGIQNAHFGIRADGTLVFGYLTEMDVLDRENPFVQLVGGVGWLLRDGEPYLDESKKVECRIPEETGIVEDFFNVIAARTAVGSDNEGRVVLAHVDGKSDSTGVSLAEFAQLLKKNGVVNAINLDGGGSTTYIINGTMVNYATDECEGRYYRCPRQVSTILCVHEPDCDPPDCSDHGQCMMGDCKCRGNWQAPRCDRLECLGRGNCSNNGLCTEDGCKCHTGFLPPDCRRSCEAGTYGQDCTSPCWCDHGGDCHPVTGECSCLPGYIGRHCQQICPYGFHGPECTHECNCGDKGCACHHITGLCTFDRNDTTYAALLNAGQCLTDRLLNTLNMAPVGSFFQNPYAIGCFVAGTIALLSLLCNVALLCHRCTCRVSSHPFLACPTTVTTSRKYRPLGEVDLSFEDTPSTDEETESSL